MYWSREHTIGRFHPIAQKQKTDLNIPLGIGQYESRDPAKTKAAGNLVAGSIGASRSVRTEETASVQAARAERAAIAGLGQEAIRAWPS